MLQEIHQYRSKISAQLQTGQKIVQGKWKTTLIIGGAALVAGTAIALLISGRSKKKLVKSGDGYKEEVSIESSVWEIVKRNLAEFITSLIKEKLTEVLHEFTEKRKSTDKSKSE